MSVRSAQHPSSSRLDLYTKVPFASLRFISTAEGFSARYDMTTEVYQLAEEERPGPLVTSRSWVDTVRVQRFRATQAEQRYDLSLHSFVLPPDRYLVRVRLENRSTGEVYSRELPVEVRDMRNGVAVSDLLLLEEYDADQNVIFPSVLGRIGSDKSNVQFFYELYADRPQSVQITQEVVRLRKKGGLSSVRRLLGMDGEQEEKVLSRRKTKQLAAGRTQAVAAIPMDSLRAGSYVSRVLVRSRDGEALASASAPFTVQWAGLDRHIRRIDEAIAQLQYIAKDDEIAQIRRAGTPAEQLRRFRAFWRKRDPTPDTGRNERMEEYYYRVSFANRNFGSIRDGWRTDRGHVHVLFGEPSSIERHFGSSSYEVWHYDGIGRRFIFVDKSGVGDYELLVPIWDERTQIR